MGYPKLPCVGLCGYWTDKGSFCLLNVADYQAKDCLKWYPAGSRLHKRAKYKVYAQITIYQS